MDKEKDPITVVTGYVEKTLKDNYIKNMVQGYEIACKTIVDMIDRGDSPEQIKAFCSNKKGTKTLLKVAKKGKK